MEIQIMKVVSHDTPRPYRIIAQVATDRRKRAEAYYLAAEWHDKQAKGCEEMAKDEPRLSADIRDAATANAVHHRSSAAGLRLAATGLLRRELAMSDTQ